MKKKLKDFIKRGKMAILITIASIGFIFVINGFLKLLPEIISGIMSIIIGFIILLIMGYLGYGIASNKK